MSIVIKICNCDGTGTVRRREFNASNATLAQVQELANLKSNKRLTWRDEDNDVIAVETQFDLQEAIAYATTQQSSLRLIVDNTGTSTETEPTAEPTPVQATSTRTPLPDMQSLVGSGYKKLISTAKIAQSTLASSKTVQGIQEDGCSIRGFLEAHVERSHFPRCARLAVGAIARGVLVWGLIFGASFCLLLKILIGTLLMPRNILTDRAREQIRILFGLLAFRTVMGFLFGLTCCLTPVLLACGLGACIFTKHNRCKRFNRIIRKGKLYMNRQRTNGRCTPNDRFFPSASPSNDQFFPSAPPSNDRFSPSVRPATQKEREDMLTLGGIFPGMNIAKLTHAYMRHKDVQKTVLELSE